MSSVLKKDQPEIGDRYILATGDAGAQRLSLLHSVYGPESERLMLSFGVPKGAKVADIGCGTGQASLWFAEQVGKNGEVMGVDISAEQLALAKKNAKRSNVNNITFCEASAYDTKLPRNYFDIIYCRLILCHLARPLEAVREMVALLKPTGLLICFDIDLGELFSIPSTKTYERISELILKIGEHRGLDYRLGLRLPLLFQEAGLSEAEMAFIHPVYRTGEKKRLWEYSFLEASPKLIEAGLCSEDEVKALTTALAAISKDETILVAQSRMPVTWARKS